MCRELELRFGWIDAQIPTSARQFLVDQLATMLPGGTEAENVVHTAGLVISELVSNAVKAGQTGPGVRLTAHSDHLRIEVSDDSPELPRVQAGLPTDIRGRGLIIVQALSSSWGVEQTMHGKNVWALVPFPAGLRADVHCTLRGQADAAAADVEPANGVPVTGPDGHEGRELRWVSTGVSPDGDHVLAVDEERLANDQVLLDLLQRVRGAVAADTATVLVRARESDELVAHAASGLEEEVRQGFRLQIGRGFAGGIAASGQARALDHVDASTVANPVLWRKGIRTMLGVPLFGTGGVMGVLHVGRLTERHFTAADSEVLQAAAMRIVTVLQSRRLLVETAAATLLERSLQPTRMPKLDGLEFAARYVPAASDMVGGDWYDAFTLPSGDLCLIMGDVAGHGLNAAVIMGRLKSALRAYTLIADTPERMLELADRKMQHFEFGTMVTVICGVAKPPFDRITLCSAGHPPPVLAAPGRQPELVELPTEAPLGVDPKIRREVATVELPIGSALVLYTDGLVERRSEPIRSRIELLRSSVPADHAETVCNTVMKELVGTASTTDDIALLAVHRAAASTAPG